MDDQNPQDDQQIPAEDEMSAVTDDMTLMQQKLEEMTGVAKTALADLSNFRRRVEEEKKELSKFANLKLIRDLLPIIDNFERAMKTETVPAGIEAIYKQFLGFIEKLELKVIPTVGEKFNAHMHEAVLEGPGEKDIITEDLEKGYAWGEFIVRHAKVKVGGGA